MRKERSNRAGFKLISASLALALVSYLSFVFPAPTLTAVAAALALLFTIGFPDSVLYIYAASLFLFQVPVQVPAPGGSTVPVSVPTLAAILFITAACLRQLISSEETTIRSRIPLLLGFVSIVYLMLALLNHRWTFAHQQMALTYFALFATTLAATYELRDPLRSWRVSWIFCVGSATVSLETIYEGWTGRYNLFGLFPSHELRAYGLADPNYTAAFLVTTLPFAFALLIRAQRTMLKLIMVAFIGLSLVGLGMTASRGGVLGCILTLGACSLFLPLSKRTRARSDRSQRRLLAGAWSRAGLLAVMLAVAGFAAYVAPQDLWDRISTTPEDEVAKPKRDDRLQIWDDYLERWRESPWIGKGAGFLEERWMEPHNTHLQNLVEVGVVGLAGFLLLNAFGFWESLAAAGRFARQGVTDLAALSGAVAASLVGFHVTAFFLTSAAHKEMWFLIGFAGALRHVSRSHQGSPLTASSPDLPLTNPLLVGNR
jgi:O-antigen ligase